MSSGGTLVGRLSNAESTPCPRHSASFSLQWSTGPQIAIASISASLTAAEASFRCPLL